MNHCSHRTHSVNSRHAWKERASPVTKQFLNPLPCQVQQKKRVECPQDSKWNETSTFFYLFIYFLKRVKSVVSHKMWHEVHLPLSSRPFTIPEPTKPAPPRTNTTLSELDMLAAAPQRMETFTRKAGDEAADEKCTASVPIQDALNRRPGAKVPPFSRCHSKPRPQVKKKTPTALVFPQSCALCTESGGGALPQSTCGCTAVGVHTFRKSKRFLEKQSR